MIAKALRFTLFAGLVVLSSVAHGDENDIVINGRKLSTFETLALQVRLGMDIPPGNYVVNTTTGCWTNLSNRTKGCLDHFDTYVSSYLADGSS